jgi:DNA-binding CsgD family transcriptional regulator/PAS domain-containing protein
MAAQIRTVPMQPDALLLDLYAGAAEPGRWPHALDRLCAATGARSAVVQAFTFEGGTAHVHWVMQDSRTQAQLRNPRGVGDGNNPRLDPKRALRGLNRVAGDEHLFEPGDDARPRLEHELAMLGLGRFIGTLQEVGRDVYLGLALHRAVDDPRDFSAEQVASLATIAPHLGQAFVLTDRMQQSAERDQRLREHLDRLRCGMVLCDAGGRVQWLNRSAQRLLDGGGPLRLVADQLHGRSQVETQALMHELAQADRAAGHAVRYLRLGGGEAVLHVAVQAAEQPSSLVLVLTEGRGIAELPAEALVRMFGLTPTEARLVGALATGSTVEQYAQLRGVSVGTARVQLKQVQAKTGVNRQSDLVRLVLSSAAAHLLAPRQDS